MEANSESIQEMTAQFLMYLNKRGEELGYPFVMFSNGECGKGLVSSDGKHNVVLNVLGAFKDYAKVQGVKQSSLGELSGMEKVQLERIKIKITSMDKLSYQEEIFLIEKGTNALFEKYINHFKLEYIAFQKIVMDGREDLVALYCKRHARFLGERELHWLQEYGTPQMMAQYNSLMMQSFR